MRVKSGEHFGDIGHTKEIGGDVNTSRGNEYNTMLG